MVSCDESELLLSRGLDGDLSGEDAQRLYRHVARCDECRRKMGELANLEKAIRQLGALYDSAVLGGAFAGELENKLAAEGGGGNVLGLREFGRRVARDAQMRGRLDATRDLSEFIACCVRLGQENGYGFGAEEVAALLDAEAANDELSDDQLERVAAAGTGFDSHKLLDFLARL